VLAPIYDGAAIFGSCCKVVHIPAANAQQVDAFFGLTGTRTLYGGGRGRIFTISGVLFAVDMTSLNAAEDLIMSYADGIGRDFTDSRGRTWPQVIFKGEFSPDANGPRPAVSGASAGYALPFKAVLYGLI
jgi:hypothetical protein